MVTRLSLVISILVRCGKLFLRYLVVFVWGVEGVDVLLAVALGVMFRGK